MFLVSKLLWVAVAPDNALLWLLVAGFLLLTFRRSRGPGVFLTGLAALGFLTLTLTPAAEWAARPLEERFAPPAAPPAHVDGIICLGGAQDTLITATRGQAALNGAAERLLVFLELARRYPNARLVFTGGSGLPAHQEVKEADQARGLLAAQGLDISRVIFEDASRNTLENARATLDLVGPEPGRTWLLVTSALHMPRAVGIFRNAGLAVTPWPVDYRTTPRFIPTYEPSLAGSLGLARAAAHEWLGLAQAWLLGASDALFPAP